MRTDYSLLPVQETFEEQLETSPDPPPPHWSRPQKFRQTDVSEHERRPRHAGMLSEEWGILGKHSAEHRGDANVSVLPRTGGKCRERLRWIVKNTGLSDSQADWEQRSRWVYLGEP